MKRRTFLDIVFYTIAGTLAPIGSFSQITPLQNEDIKIAFLADVHFQDIFGQLTETDFNGIQNPLNNKNVLIRTMASQLRSTRLFNENYFAFLTALDNIAQRDIKLVVLPGDFSDDGQALHLRKLREIFTRYEKLYKMQFFVITGNHDPSAPFFKDAGKTDFLGKDGKNQPIFSKKGMYNSRASENPTVISPDIAKLGYQGIVNELKDFGFMPKPNFIYWETPFTKYNPENYSFKEALSNSKLSDRTYEITYGNKLPDTSYLVEPISGIWLLAIDGNMYYPKNKNGNAKNHKKYNGSGLGYNNIQKNKKYLFDWILKVTDNAKKFNKKLITFSHFPMVDFNDNVSPVLERLLGKEKWQLARVPSEDIAHIFADIGIKIHIAGHMHINDTGVSTSPKGNTIVNIQTPSLAAYQPAYKILTFHDNQKAEIETVTIDSVSRFNEIFPLYEQEYDFLKCSNNKNIWDSSILKCKSYHDFTLFHLKELVRFRFINDWPEPIKGFLYKNNLKEIGKILNITLPDSAKNFGGIDLLIDFYKLRNADTLALRDISIEQQKLYMQLINSAKSAEREDLLTLQLKDFFKCIDAFWNGKPSNNFFVDLKTGQISAIQKL